MHSWEYGLLETLSTVRKVGERGEEERKVTASTQSNPSPLSYLVPRLRNLNGIKAISFLKFQALYDIAKVHFFTKFLSPYKHSIQQAKITISAVLNTPHFPFYEFCFHCYLVIQGYPPLHIYLSKCHLYLCHNVFYIFLLLEKLPLSAFVGRVLMI